MSVSPPPNELSLPKRIMFVPSTVSSQTDTSLEQDDETSVFEEPTTKVINSAESISDFYQSVISLPPSNKSSTDFSSDHSFSLDQKSSISKTNNTRNPTRSYKKFVGHIQSPVSSAAKKKSSMTDHNKSSINANLMPTTSIITKSSFYSSDNQGKDTWFCESCSIHIPSHTVEQHLRGTAHLMSYTPEAQVPVDPLVLNETNIGFRMLRGQGWSYEKGLGVNEQGRRLPVFTKWKSDRSGIGVKSKSTASSSLNSKKVYISDTIAGTGGQQEDKLPQGGKRLLSAKETAQQEEKNRKQRINMIAYMNR
ncbi:hypothetical protein G9A89_011433 [Geosiphon pyriformis]|nr:hypothetical protein G9A89_011433 [Geosiphon pyriformis]